MSLANILAVGSYENHKRAELLSTGAEQKWTVVEDYPYSG